MIKRVVARRKNIVTIHEHCPDRPYVELVVPEDFRAACYVEYTIDSRDQGIHQRWPQMLLLANTKCTTGFCDDPKSPSYSWFEASVRRRHDRNNLRNIPVAWNRVGNSEFHNRTADRWTPTHPWGVNWKPWLKALLPGDVIELVPKAIYPGWLNIVREAQIKLEYEAAEAYFSTGHYGRLSCPRRYTIRYASEARFTPDTRACYPTRRV